MRYVASICACIVLAFAAGAHADDDQEPQPVVTKAPALTHFEEAIYPPDEKAKGVESTVVLAISLDDKGAVLAIAELPAGTHVDLVIDVSGYFQ